MYFDLKVAFLDLLSLVDAAPQKSDCFSANVGRTELLKCVSALYLYDLVDAARQVQLICMLCLLSQAVFDKNNAVLWLDGCRAL